MLAVAIKHHYCAGEENVAKIHLKCVFDHILLVVLVIYEILSHLANASKETD